MTLTVVIDNSVYKVKNLTKRERERSRQYETSDWTIHGSKEAHSKIVWIIYYYHNYKD